LEKEGTILPPPLQRGIEGDFDGKSPPLMGEIRWECRNHGLYKVLLGAALKGSTLNTENRKPNTGGKQETSITAGETL
jgi:hypothetical protein